MASSLIGSLRIALGLETAAFETGSRKTKKELSGLERHAKQVKVQMAGMLAGVSVAALGVAAKRALDYASSLGEVAQQLGVNTRELQVWRYAATQYGVTQAEMDKGLQKFTRSLGDARTGAAETRRVFKALGFSDREIKQLDVSSALRKTVDALAAIEDPAQRAAAGSKLFGRAFQQLDPLFTQGARGFDDLAAAADRLGIVLSDEQIQSADETADKLAAMKVVLEARIAGVVADNADSILKLADSLGKLAGSLAEWWAQDPGQAGAILGGMVGLKVGARFGPWGAIGGAAVGAAGGYFMSPSGQPAPVDIPKLEQRLKKRERDLAEASSKLHKDRMAGYMSGEMNYDGLRIQERGVENLKSEIVSLKKQIATARRAALAKPKASAPATLAADGPGGTLDLYGTGKGKNDERTDEQVYRDFQRELQRVGITPTSGKRSKAEQAALYAKLGPGNAAPPGSSDHEIWKAMDFAPNVDRQKLALAAARAGVELGPELVHGKKRHLHQTFSKGGKGGGEAQLAKAAEEEERKRKERLREAYELEVEERRASLDLLRAKQHAATDADTRAALGRDILTIEQAQEVAAIDHQVAMGERSQASADSLKATISEKHAIEQSAAFAEEIRDALEEEVRQMEADGAVQAAHHDLRMELLDIEAGLARTAEERRAVELRILDAAMEEERRRLELIKATHAVTDVEYQIADARLRQLDAIRSGNAEGIRRGTMGPLEDYLDQITLSAAELNEAVQEVGVDGLATLNEGLAQASASWIKMGGIAGSVLKEIWVGIARILVARFITAPLGNYLSGMVGGSGLMPGAGSQFPVLNGGGVFTGLPPTGDLSSIPGYATGGAMRLGGMAGVDTNLLSLNGVPIARVTQNETMEIRPSSDRGGGGVTINQHFSPNFAGNAATHQDLAMMGRIAKAETLAAVRDLRGRRAL